ncbi:MAG: T9SS type A sorting domain-containing protein [Bacteroidales bacterium]|nr:T9SS type A sorting domain-containing protein [Bacteroidales bacterium]
MYIESSNIGSDYIGTEFIDYLGFTYLEGGGESEVNLIVGVNNTITHGLRMNYFGGTSPHYSVDRISSFGGTIFTCNDNIGRMVMNQTENYSVVSSSVVLGALANGDSLNLKPFLITEIVYKFLEYNPAVSMEEPETGISKVSNFPNPAYSSTTIKYQLQKPGKVSAIIFDANGKKIKSLFDGWQPSGNFALNWNLTTENGQPVKPGVCFYQLKTDAAVYTGKITVL